MQGDKITGALIGLSGAVSNNGKTEHTDEIVREALLERKNGEREEELLQKIREEKYRISPNCATCQNPCGNTSDYDMTKFYQAEEEILSAKERLLEAMEQSLKNLTEKEEISELVYRGLSFLGYDLEREAYERLIVQLKEDNSKR